MAKYNSVFYEGGDYGLDPNYGGFLGMTYRTPFSAFGITTDARTANQIKAVGEKLKTGAKTMEIGSISPEVLESIPNQHLDELNRLRKLAGVEFTFHAPTIEPTGFSRYGWNESLREQSERQMWSALERSHKLDPKGNIVVTFHSSAGLPEGETKVYNKETKEEEIKEVYVVDEKTGKIAPIVVEKDYLTGAKPNPQQLIEKQNKDIWSDSLQHINFNVNNGAHIVNSIMGKLGENQPDDVKGDIKAFRNSGLFKKKYKEYAEGKLNLNDSVNVVDQFGDVKNKELIKGLTRHAFLELEHGEIYLRRSYQELQDLYNKAYTAAEREDNKEDLEKLKKFARSVGPSLKNIEDPDNVAKLAEVIQEGVHVLKTIKTPQLFRPLKDFAVEKASETFANLAVRSYDKFKDSSPVIAIENPPAGMGLSTAEDLRKVIKETRKKFTKKAMKEFNMSKSEAEDQADKLIGATWDVGHINMIRKYGYGKKELEEQTRKIAKYVKKVHLSDNFGMEHTELPMGMGNVPIKKEMEILDKHAKKVKKIIEAVNWYQNFQTTPLSETLEAFGSPIYGMKMAPYWNQAVGQMAGYYAGYGMNPEVHHTIYGSGFSNLPLELGGQMAGKSRMGGAPID